LKVRIVQAPYDSGHRGVRMGRGPEHLVYNGLPERLHACGHEVRAEVIEVEEAFTAEIATAFALHRLVAGRVRAADEEGEFPLVLSGNCNTSSVGTLAGLGRRGIGVIWFDAHADFSTPETTTSGFLDGMGLSIAVGACWKAMTEKIPGFLPVPEASVVHVGARDVAPAERERLLSSGVTVVEAGMLRERGTEDALRAALDGLRERVGRVYVHLDLDVLDAEGVGPANGFAGPGGLRTEDVADAIGMIRGRFVLAAAGMASYDPAHDPGGRVLSAGLELAEALISEG
jgi:arginase